MVSGVPAIDIDLEKGGRSERGDCLRTEMSKSRNGLRVFQSSWWRDLEAHGMGSSRLNCIGL